MRIIDGSSDVCSSDLEFHVRDRHAVLQRHRIRVGRRAAAAFDVDTGERSSHVGLGVAQVLGRGLDAAGTVVEVGARRPVIAVGAGAGHEGLVGIPSVAGGEQVARPVVDTGRVVDVEAVVIIVGAEIGRTSCRENVGTYV